MKKMFIYEILEKDIQIRLDLLYILLKNNSWVDINKLSKQSGYDRKTVTKYGQLLMHETKKADFIEARTHIDFKKGKGFKFFGDKIVFLSHYISIIETSFTFNLLMTLFLKPQPTINELLEKNFVSLSTLQRKVKQLNSIFEQADLSIKISDNKVILQGNEVQIRYIYSNLIWQVYRGITWPFETVNQNKIQSFIEKEMATNFLVKDIEIMHWCYIFTVNLIRNTQNQKIVFEDIPNFVQKMQETISLKYITTNKLLKTKFHFSNEEIIALTLFIQILPDFYLLGDNFEKALDIHRSLDNDIYHLYKLFFLFAEEELHLKPGAKEQLLYQSIILAAFTHSAIFTTVTEISPYTTAYNFSRHLEKRYPNLKKEMEKLITKMKQVSDSPLLDNTKILTLRFCEAYSLVASPTDFEKPLLLKLETDFSTVIEHILAEQLESLLSPFYNVEVIPSSEFSNERADIIIYTTSVWSTKNEQSIPTIYINPEFELIDIDSVIEKIETVMN